MELKIKNLIDSIDLNKSEAMLPIYESIVNSIISLNKTDSIDKSVEVFIERENMVDEPDLFCKQLPPIKTVTIVDNGVGFTSENYDSFNSPFSQYNKKFGCKGVGRFTMLAMFENIHIVSMYMEGNKSWKRSFDFNAQKEVYNHTLVETNETVNQTKVTLSICHNDELKKQTARNADEIAKGIMEHCFIYYLCNELPNIRIIELSKNNNSNKALSLSDYFKKEYKDKERDIEIKNESFHLYITKSDKTTSRKYNYVTLCANSRQVGSKYNLSDYDSLYLYPINEGGTTKFLDVYVVSSFLDSKINNSRTAFKIPESNYNDLGFSDNELPISIQNIMDRISQELSMLYESYAKETKERNIREVKSYIMNKAPQYRSFLFREDILNAMPPNISDEKKDAYLHAVAYQENNKINEKIREFLQMHDYNEESITDIINTFKAKSAYDANSLTDYVCRRKAILTLFERMLDAKENGKYELEKVIHNIIFPMGLTNREITYQYHNLWLLDDRLSTFKFIASDKSITSYSQIKSSHEPDLIMLKNEKLLIDNPISFGDKDAGRIGMMVIFEFKRPGDTAHQKRKGDFRWEFSELVESYFDDFMFGPEKNKKNYRGHVVNVTCDTPKFGYIIMDEMPDKLITYNLSKGWRKTPFDSYYKMNPDQNLHIEAISFQDLLKNAKERNNPFFDHLFTSKI